MAALAQWNNVSIIDNNITEMDVHVQQTNDRLQCIRQHLQSAGGFQSAARELLEWCSDTRAFQWQFEQNLIACLTVVSQVAAQPGFDLDLGYRLLAVCAAHRDKFVSKTAGLLPVWCEELGRLLMLRHDPSKAGTRPLANHSTTMNPDTMSPIPIHAMSQCIPGRDGRTLWPSGMKPTQSGGCPGSGSLTPGPQWTSPIQSPSILHPYNGGGGGPNQPQQPPQRQPSQFEQQQQQQQGKVVCTAAGGANNNVGQKCGFSGHSPAAATGVGGTGTCVSSYNNVTTSPAAGTTAHATLQNGLNLSPVSNATDSDRLAVTSDDNNVTSGVTSLQPTPQTAASVGGPTCPSTIPDDVCAAGRLHGNAMTPVNGQQQQQHYQQRTMSNVHPQQQQQQQHAIQVQNCYAAGGPAAGLLQGPGGGGGMPGSACYPVDPYGCPAMPVGGPRSAGAGGIMPTSLHRGRPAPYPTSQQYMLAKRAPFYGYQNSPYNQAGNMYSSQQQHHQQQQQQYAVGLGAVQQPYGWCRTAAGYYPAQQAMCGGGPTAPGPGYAMASYYGGGAGPGGPTAAMHVAAGGPTGPPRYLPQQHAGGLAGERSMVQSAPPGYASPFNGSQTVAVNHGGPGSAPPGPVPVSMFDTRTSPLLASAEQTSTLDRKPPTAGTPCPGGPGAPSLHGRPGLPEGPTIPAVPRIPRNHGRSERRGMPDVPGITGGPGAELSELRLTFPVRDGVVLPPFRLEHNLAVSNHVFHLRESVYQALLMRSDLELQLKCFHHEDSQMATNWPASVAVSVNATPLMIQRPGPLGTTPDQRILHRPLLLKDVCRAGRNTIQITVTACCCSHLFVVQLVHRPSLRSVLQGLLHKRLLPADHCILKIKRSFSQQQLQHQSMTTVCNGGGNTEPVADQVAMRLSLKCPITYRFIGLPARGHECKHVQCFDLDSYLRLNCDRGVWRCPICSKPALLESLEIDQYIWGILQSMAGSPYDEVSIDTAACWKPIPLKTNSTDQDMGEPVDPRLLASVSPSMMTLPTASSWIELYFPNYGGAGGNGQQRSSSPFPHMFPDLSSPLPYPGCSPFDIDLCSPGGDSGIQCYIPPVLDGQSMSTGSSSTGGGSDFLGSMSQMNDSLLARSASSSSSTDAAAAAGIQTGGGPPALQLPAGIEESVPTPSSREGVSGDQNPGSAAPASGDTQTTSRKRSTSSSSSPQPPASTGLPPPENPQTPATAPGASNPDNATMPEASSSAAGLTPVKIEIKTEPGMQVDEDGGDASTASAAAAAAAVRSTADSSFEVESIEFACSLTFDTTDLISGGEQHEVIDLLGADSFGDPTELLPYLGPGDANGNSTFQDKPMSANDDLLELFS